MSARSVPDELVEAAAEALDEASHYAKGDIEMGGEHNAERRLVAARVALQAAFAKLPECEAAANVVAAALVKAWNEQPYVGQTAMADAETALAALAREFGDGEASRG